MDDTKKILAANLNALIATHPEFNSNPKVAKRSKVGLGTVGRIRNAEVSATLDSVAALAEAFGLEPWQLLVPGLDPDAPPALHPTGVPKEALYKKMEELAQQIVASSSSS